VNFDVLVGRHHIRRCFQFTAKAIRARSVRSSPPMSERAALSFKGHPAHNGCIRVYPLNRIGVYATARRSRPPEHQSLEENRPHPTFLGSQGMKKGDLSKFIEQAVRAHVFHCTVQGIKARNARTDPDELQSLIDSKVRQVRAERHAKTNTGKA